MSQAPLTAYDLDQLEAVAKAALGDVVGDWTYLDIGEVVLDDDDMPIIATVCEDLLSMDNIGARIAAFHPATTLRLIAAARGKA
jgi:hypothetical protein